VASCIEKFNHEIAYLPRRRRPALERAIFLKPSIETDVTFKLMFLRADYYDASKAARRLAKYFEDKLHLFGEDKLVKKITLDDLSEEDMEVFQTCFFMYVTNPFQTCFFMYVTNPQRQGGSTDLVLRCLEVRF
jgi:hypothetical protein